MNYKISLIECPAVDMLPEAEPGEDRTHLADKRAIRAAALDAETATEETQDILYADSALFFESDDEARMVCTRAALMRIYEQIDQHEKDKARLKVITLN